MYLIRGVKGQVTIFIIIAIVIVGVIILFFAATDTGRGVVQGFTSGGEFDVRSNLETCINENEKIFDDINTIMIQGGNLNPELNYMFESVNISYLCYTNEFYKFCTNHQPVLVPHIESEILAVVTPEVDSCIRELRENLDNRNFDVTSGKLEVSVELVPENIIINVDYPLTITSADSTRNFRNFEISINSKAYGLITLSNSIINFEARLGESDPATYMALYPSIKVEKLKQGDGTTIYKLSDRDTEETFNFATRSRVFPPGYV